MPKRSVAGLSIAFVLLAIIIVASASLTETANYIDTAHWIGNPLPPCFVDSKLCAGHLLGTDEVGRDMLARLTVGLRTSLIVSLVALVFSVGIAALLALLARRSSVASMIVGRIADAISSISPWAYLMIVSAISLGKKEPILGGLWLALWGGILCWPALWRTMIATWSPRPILRKAERDLSTFLLVFAAVDFFGFGIQPPLPSLGNMLVNMQENMQIGWWIAVMPAIVIFALVLGVEITARVGEST
jgi:peptide/nickel transport system permease protein